MKPFQINNLASDEFADAVRWYEQQRHGLGAELFDAVSQAIDLIRENPEIGASRTGRFPTRQFLLRRFPYKVVYRDRPHDIYVVAVAHTSRRPNFWKTRG